MKKFIATLLAAAIAVTYLPQAAVAAFLPQEESLASEDVGSDFVYEDLEDGTISITGYFGSDTELVIPPEIDGKRVTVIGYRSFYDNDSITKITLPDSITTIGDYAFSCCYSLGKINIPDGVTSIGNYAFYSCYALAELTIPNSVVEIGYDAFTDDDILLYGHRGSYAEAYAKEYGIAFIDPDYTIVDKDSGVTVSAIDWALPEGAELNVDVTDGENYEIYYNIYITVNGKEYPFGGQTEIYLPFESWGYNIKTKLTDEKGDEITDFDQRSDSIYFTVDHSGTYAVAPEKSVPQGSLFAGLTFMTDIYSFRDNINQSVGYYCDENYELAEYPNWSVNDAEITGNGTYTVSFDRDLVKYNDTTESAWNTLKLQTNISPYDYPNFNIKVDSLKIDGKEIESAKNVTLSEDILSVDDYSDVYGYLPGHSSYMDVYALVLLNVWSNELNIRTDDFGKKVELTFTVSGFKEVYKDFEYEESRDGTITITKYNGDDAEVEVPAEINGKKVTEIGYGAFDSCYSLTAVTLPDSITTIGDSAFEYCYELTEITLPDSLTTIGGWAFCYCSSLTEINLPDSLITIGYGAFESCFSLLTVAIPDGVTTIENWTFEYCSSLTEITIPQSVTKIDFYAFFHCSSLTGIYVDDNNKVYKDIDGVLYSKDGKTIMYFPNGIAGAYVIPDGVTTIPDNLFSNCYLLTELTIPDSVVEIGDNVFDYDNDILIYGHRGSYAETYAKENGIAFIDPDYTIVNESSHVTISAIDWDLPEGAELNVDVSYGENYETYYNIYITVNGKEYPFGGQTEIYIPFESWGENIKAKLTDEKGTEITDVKQRSSGIYFTAEHSGKYTIAPKKSVPQGSLFAGLTFQTDIFSFRNNINQSVGYYRDEYNELLEYPNWSVNDAEITGNGTYTVSFERDLVNDGFMTESAWNRLTLQTNISPDDNPEINITIDSLKIDGKEIESAKNASLSIDGLYVDPYSDTYGYIPEDSSYIDTYNLIFFNTWDDDGSIESDDFGKKVEVTFTISGLSEVYQDFEYVELEDGTITIIKYNGDDAEVEVPAEINGKKVTKIGGRAFSWNSSITKITLPDSITTIGENAFSYCTSLEKINLPDGVTTIGYSAFSGCYKLANITIPDSVTTINGRAFAQCSSLTQITIPDNVTTIGYNAFYECTSLAEITIPDSVKAIYDQAFAGCSALKNITLPKSITSIAYKVFGNCSSLAEIEIPDSVQSIGDGAFINCTSLEKAVILPSVTKISASAFSTDSGSVLDLTIYGYTNSYAETYANEYKIPFVALGLFLDSDNGVSVTVDKGSVPDDTQLEVEQTEKTDTSVSYDITLTQNGKEIQPDGEVTVRIPVPEGWSGEEIHVYHKDENGNLTDMNAVVSGGYIIFTTNHFSEYIITTEKLIETKIGDVNGDGIVNEPDSVALARYLAQWNVTIDESVADLDGNGKVEEIDNVILARRLAGWNV